MPSQIARRISLLLTIGLTLSCLFFLGTNSCRAFLFEQNNGPFCSVEQASAQSPFETPDVHMSIYNKKDSVTVPVPTAAIFFIILIILLSDAAGKAYARKVDESLIFHGPYKKMFLPYMMATHGM